MKTIIEPFKIKSVEPLRFTCRVEREKILKHAGYNLFNIHAEDVLGQAGGGRKAEVAETGKAVRVMLVLIALPLRWPGLDASPVRAVLRETSVEG